MAGNKHKPEKFLYLVPEDAKTFIVHAYQTRVVQGILWDITLNGGLRISEALAIRPCDFKPGNYIEIRTLKQKRKNPDGTPEEMIAPILFPSGTINIATKYIQHTGTSPSEKLFPFTRQNAWLWFKTILMTAKLDHLYSPHALRHAHGIMVSMATGGDAMQIARRLRHANANNAYKYVHLSGKDQEKIVSFIENIGKGEEKK